MHNLIDEIKWLPVLTCDGRRMDMSLASVLVNAADIHMVYGEHPSQTAALYRLVATAAVACHPEWSRDTIDQIRAQGGFDSARVVDYLMTYRDRFDLTGTATPFMQITNVANTPKRMENIDTVRSTGSNRLFYDHNGRPNGYDPAAAARTLVTAHQQHACGTLATPLIGTSGELPKGSRPITSAVSGPINNTPVYLITADNLVESILLNMPANMTGPYDAPYWEQPYVEPELDVDGAWIRVARQPLGMMDWLTWQSRLIRMHFDEKSGTYASVTVAAGLLLEQSYAPKGTRRIPDPHIAWSEWTEPKIVAKPTTVVGDPMRPSSITKKSATAEKVYTVGVDGVSDIVAHDDGKKYDVYTPSWVSTSSPSVSRFDWRGTIPPASVIEEISLIDWNVDGDEIPRIRLWKLAQHADQAKIYAHEETMYDLTLVPGKNASDTPIKPSAWVDEYLSRVCRNSCDSFAPENDFPSIIAADETEQEGDWRWRLEEMS